MRLIISLILVIIISNSLFSQPEILTKKGGVCFRIDDNQPINYWNDYRSVFNKYNYKFCAAINATGIIGNSEYINLIKLLQNDGHEIMDHTPDHVLHFFRKVNNINDYFNRKGVDHINGDKVCLSFEKVDTSTYIGEGLIDITRDTVISHNNGEFKDLNNIFNIYLPDSSKLFSIYNIYNKNSLDPDTITIRSFWAEPINIGVLKNVRYQKIGLNDIQMFPEAIDILAERTQYILKQYNINNAKTFIQPGGQLSGTLFNFSTKELKEHYSKYNVLAAALYQSKILKCINEFNANGLNQYSMQWGDFQEDINSFNGVKKIIAERLALHYFSVGHSHFFGLLGGWNGYLARMDSLLSWCAQKDIPVVTYSEMAQKLNYSKFNPYENVFPKLDVDLDQDDLPDGYRTGFGLFDKTDGVIQSSNKSFSRASSGTLTSISGLGGIEKGENNFIIYTKGENGDSIRVIFQFEGNPNTNKTFIFPANTNSWQKYSLSNMNKSYFIPDSINTLTIIIATHTFISGTVKISGMEMRKKSSSVIIPPFALQPILTNDKVSLSWINNETDNSTKIKVQREKEGDSNFTDIAVTDSGNNYVDQSVLPNQTYYYRLQAFTSTNLTSNYSDTVKVNTTVTDVKIDSDLPNEFTLYQNYPNPFNPSTMISYQIPVASNVSLKLYDILGREISTLINEFQNAGHYSFQFSTNSLRLASGIYFYTIKSDKGFIQSKKMVLLK